MAAAPAPPTPPTARGVPLKPVPIALGVLVGALSLVVAIVLYSKFGQADIRFGVRGYAPVSDTAVRVQFEVDKDAASSALCKVRARDATGAEVGVALVPVGRGGRVVVDYTLDTTGRAVTGEVVGCSLQPA